MRVECFISYNENSDDVITFEVFDFPEVPQINDEIDFSSWVDDEELTLLEINDQNPIVYKRLWYRANGEVILQLFCKIPNPSSSE